MLLFSKKSKMCFHHSSATFLYICLNVWVLEAPIEHFISKYSSIFCHIPDIEFTVYWCTYWLQPLKRLTSDFFVFRNSQYWRQPLKWWLWQNNTALINKWINKSETYTFKIICIKIRLCINLSTNAGIDHSRKTASRAEMFCQNVSYL